MVYGLTMHVPNWMRVVAWDSRQDDPDAAQEEIVADPELVEARLLCSLGQAWVGADLQVVVESQAEAHSLVLDNCVGFDLDQRAAVDQAGHLDERVGRSNLAEDFAVRPGNFAPIVEVDHIGACPHHVLERRPHLLQRHVDFLQNVRRLRIRICLALQLPACVMGSGA